MDEIPPSTHCVRGELMDNFGIFIQGILGMIAFSTLMLKRMKEPKKQRRPWRIWFYDTSKQGFGALFIHFANIYLADAFSAYDPCTFYLISFLLDSTVGLLLIYIGLKLTQYVVRSLNCHSLYFGEYGDPPKCNAWLGQCLLYLIVMMMEKILVGLMCMPSFWQEVRKYMLSWITNPHLEVILVMLIIPFVVNTLMFWVIDNFLMKKSKRLHGSGDVYSTITVGSKVASKEDNFRVSYKLAKRSGSLDSSEEGEEKNPSNVRYHKLGVGPRSESKRSSKKLNDSDETLLLLQEDPEPTKDTEFREDATSNQVQYFNENSLDSEQSHEETEKTHKLLTRNIKRL